MKISILTLFPEMFAGPFDYSIINRAKEKKLVEIEYSNIRDFGLTNHKTVDDTPYGGGVGMVMKVDVVHKAIEFAKTKSDGTQKVILMTASGTRFTQEKAWNYAKIDHLIILCGHYEGIDDRVLKYIDEEISIGDFVLTGGEIPAMLVTDAVVRLVADVLPEDAPLYESYAEDKEGNKLLEYPHYTKPVAYDGQTVPEVLLSGNHKKIAEWRKEKSIEKTKKIRPDLLKK